MHGFTLAILLQGVAVAMYIVRCRSPGCASPGGADVRF